MRNLIYIILLLAVNNLLCQDYELPKMSEYESDNYIWPDSITENQVEYWDNGNVKIKYQDIDNHKKIRKEYTYEGKLKLTVEINQKHTIDTICILNVNTGMMEYSFNVGYMDVPDGKYLEYRISSDRNKGYPITIGQYAKGKRYGKWIHENQTNNCKEEAHYNINGYLEGEYIKYYSRYHTDVMMSNNEIIKWKGQFGLVSDSEPNRNSKTERIGTWTLLDTMGKVIGRITYEWEL